MTIPGFGEEELVSLHRITCDCERCKQVRALERESCRPSPYFRSPEKKDNAHENYRYWVAQLGGSFLVYSPAGEIVAFRPDQETAEQARDALNKQLDEKSG